MSFLKDNNKKGKKNKVKTKKSKPVQFDVVGYDFDKEQKELESQDERALVRYPESMAREGDNVYMVLPGTVETRGNMMLSKRGHGYKAEGCTRTSSSERFEACPKCDHWWKFGTRKADKEKGMSHPADALYPAVRGVLQTINITPFVEHESVREGDKIVEKPIGDEIDMDRVKSKPCFLDLDKFDASSKKCKECFAFYSCFQGPQYMLLSGERVKEYTQRLGKLGGKKVRTGKIKIGKKKIALKGNIGLAWWVLMARQMGATTKEELKKCRKIAAKIAYPVVLTKTVDAKKNKQYGTKYSIGFGSSTFVMPAAWQERALARARNLAEYCKPISVKQARIELKAWLAANSDKPACFDDDDTKDTDACVGEDACKYYDSCCKEKGKKNKTKKKGKKNKTKKKGKKTKQDAVHDMMDDDTSDADLIARLKGREDFD